MGNFTKMRMGAYPATTLTHDGHLRHIVLNRPIAVGCAEKLGGSNYRIPSILPRITWELLPGQPGHAEEDAADGSSVGRMMMMNRKCSRART